MSVCDWVLLAFVILGAWYGWQQGTINVVARVGAIIIGYAAGRKFSAVLAAYVLEALPALTASGEASSEWLAFLSLFINTDGVVNRLLELLLFVVIFIVTSWLIRSVARAMTSLFCRGLLGSINRGLGLTLAALIAVALILICADIVFPAIATMGISTAPSGFFADSAVVLPAIRYIQYLI